MPNIEVHPSAEQLAHAAAERFVTSAERAIAADGRFSVALAGGNTPKALYALLATPAYAERIKWSDVHFFWGDERCVPPGDPQSNYRMVRETLLMHVPIPEANVHRLRGELEPSAAADNYASELRRFFGANEAGAPQSGFDLVLLGMGDDGHTASLFPGGKAVHENTRWAMSEFVPTVNMWRLTLTPVVLNAAREVVFLVTGAGKAARLQQVIYGPRDPATLPSQAIAPGQGEIIWMIDQAAAQQLGDQR